MWLGACATIAVTRRLDLVHPSSPRVDDRRVISGIMHMLRSGPRLPAGIRPLYDDRFNRWSRQGVWTDIFYASPRAQSHRAHVLPPQGFSRRIATRYDKRADIFLSTILLAAALTCGGSKLSPDPRCRFWLSDNRTGPVNVSRQGPHQVSAIGRAEHSAASRRPHSVDLQYPGFAVPVAHIRCVQIGCVPAPTLWQSLQPSNHRVQEGGGT